MSFHSSPIYVYVVARPLICWGFEKLVHTAYLGIQVVGTAHTLDDALTSIRDVRVDLMVVDHDECTRTATLEEAAKLVPVLLLAGESQDFVGDHIAAVVSKRDSPATLLRAIEDACERVRRRSARPPGFSRFNHIPVADPDRIRISKLTTRERELIVALLCSDTEPGKVIASRLCISEQTLRNHLSSIYGKLGVHSRLGLHAFAARHGLGRPRTEQQRARVSSC